MDDTLVTVQESELTDRQENTSPDTQESRSPDGQENISPDAREQIREAAHIWCGSLCKCAGESEAYADKLWKRLEASPGIYEEFIYYMLHQDFKCGYKVCDLTIVDILVWQVDLFKAGMDMQRTERDNPDRLLLTAFVTMLDMEEDPEELITRYRNDTGTDYPGKY